MNPARLAWALVTKGLILCDLKGEDDYREFLEEATVWVERSGNDRARCYLHVINVRSFLNAGRYEMALKTALEGVELAEKLGEGILAVFLFAVAGRSALYSANLIMPCNFFTGENQKVRKLGTRWVWHISGYIWRKRSSVQAVLKRRWNLLKPRCLFVRLLDLGSVFQTALETNAMILACSETSDEALIDGMLEQAAALVERSNSPWMKIQYLTNRARIGLKRDKIEDALKDLIIARNIHLEMGLENGTGELRLLEEALRKSTI